MQLTQKRGKFNRVAVLPKLFSCITSQGFIHWRVKNYGKL